MLGIEHGLRRASVPVRPVVYVEREAFVAYNLAKQIEQGRLARAPIWTDLKTFDCEPFVGKVHGVIGGYPCQGESLAGRRELENYEGYLWPYIRRHVDRVRPLFCFFENVGSHLRGTFPYVLSDLRSMGYAVEAGLYSAFEAGATHQRERVFILAYADAQKFRRCLADAGGERGKREYVERRVPSGTRTSDEAVGGEHPDAGRPGGRMADAGGESVGVEPATRKRKDTAGYGTVGEAVEHADRERFQGSYEQGTRREKDWPTGRTSSDRTDRPDKVRNYGRPQFPTGPGRIQEPWEAPRLVAESEIESGLGRATHGFDFRADILRLLGNGVVPQQAEVAWRYLLKKVPR